MARSKQRKSSRADHKRSQQTAQPSRRIRRWAKPAAITLTFFTFIMASLAAFSHLNRVEQDLTVVGNGTPTVVQVHDPSCPLCNRLKRNLEAVNGEYLDDLQFKVANLNTQSGKAFSEQHNASSVTLLLFNEHGRLVGRLEGVSSEEDINQALSKLARR